MLAKYCLVVPIILATGYLQYTLHYTADDGYTKIASLKKEIRKIEKNNDTRRNENKILSSDLQQIRHNPEYFETAARKILFMIKENEVYVLPE